MTVGDYKRLLYGYEHYAHVPFISLTRVRFIAFARLSFGVCGYFRSCSTCYPIIRFRALIIVLWLFVWCAWIMLIAYVWLLYDVREGFMLLWKSPSLSVRIFWKVDGRDSWVWKLLAPIIIYITSLIKISVAKTLRKNIVGRKECIIGYIKSN